MLKKITKSLGQKTALWFPCSACSSQLQARGWHHLSPTCALTHLAWARGRLSCKGPSLPQSTFAPGTPSVSARSVAEPPSEGLTHPVSASQDWHTSFYHPDTRLRVPECRSQASPYLFLQHQKEHLNTGNHAVFSE